MVCLQSSTADTVISLRGLLYCGVAPEVDHAPVQSSCSVIIGPAVCLFCAGAWPDTSLVESESSLPTEGSGGLGSFQHIVRKGGNDRVDHAVSCTSFRQQVP